MMTTIKTKMTTKTTSKKAKKRKIKIEKTINIFMVKK